MINHRERMERYRHPSQTSMDFAKIRIDSSSLEDGILEIKSKSLANFSGLKKERIFRAIANNDTPTMREISVTFARISGIYQRLISYMSNLYRYDWYITPYFSSNSSRYVKKATADFNKLLYILDNTRVKNICTKIAYSVLLEGCFYGYKIYNKNAVNIQELPIKYCRSRYSKYGSPIVEFNMKYFDDNFKDPDYRERVLKVFGDEFIKGYKAYVKNKLKPDFSGDQNGWYKLDEKYAFKISITKGDYPFFIAVIPAIMDLNDAKELDKQKMEQQLLKLIIQKVPLDKEGELLFDVDEIKEMHKNAVQMLGKVIGVDVLTTVADVGVEDMAESKNSTGADELEKVERNLFNESGISQLQFNANGNIALQSSILNDESSMSTIIEQFTNLFDSIVQYYVKANPNKYYFRFNYLLTTWYNYKEMIKIFKEQTQLGYSKIFPVLASGVNQSEILAMIEWENNILNLSERLSPPISSNTMSAKDIKEVKNQNGETGRPEKDDSEKSDKTIQNREAMN